MSILDTHRKVHVESGTALSRCHLHNSNFYFVKAFCVGTYNYITFTYCCGGWFNKSWCRVDLFDIRDESFHPLSRQFDFAKECLQAVDIFEQKWNEHLQSLNAPTVPQEQDYFRELIGDLL